MSTPFETTNINLVTSASLAIFILKREVNRFALLSMIFKETAEKALLLTFTTPQLLA